MDERQLFKESFGVRRGLSDIERLRERVRELEDGLADERGVPRLGEDFRLECGQFGGDEISYFAEDCSTRILVYMKLKRRGTWRG